MLLMANFHKEIVLEVAFGTINAWLGSMEHAERVASNAIPNVAIFLGEHVDLTAARAWRAYWQEQIEGYGQVPILGGGPKPEVMDLRGTGTDQLYIQWHEMLLRVIAMAFGLSPLTLALQRDVNRSTAKQEDVQDWDSIKPVAGTVKDYLDRRLLWKTLGFTTLEFEWQIKDTDELRQAQILELQWNMDAVTVDELRAIYEREPLPNGLGQLTKTPFTGVIQQQTTTPDVGALGGPPQLDADGRWTDAHPQLPLKVEDVGESDDLERLLHRARRVLEREEARQQAASSRRSSSREWWQQAAAG